MDIFESPQRVDSAIGFSEDDEPPATPFLPFEAAQLLAGVGIILDYLNKGNSFAELTGIKARAFNWCVEYYGTVFYEHGTIGAIMKAHPRLFRLDIPSALRLDCSPADDDDDADAMDQDDCEQNDQSDERFPFADYSEPVVLNDDVLYRVLELYDEKVAMRDITFAAQFKAPRHTFNHSISAADLQDSPIIFYIPAVVCHLSSLPVAALTMNEKPTTSHNSEAQSAMELDDTDQDTDQLMPDFQSENFQVQGPWSLLSSIIRA